MLNPTTLTASLFTAILTLPLVACANTPEGFASLPVAETPRFDAIAFFEGPSEGRGRLKKVLSGTVPVGVTSVGVVEADGSLTLVQRIEEGDKEPRTREWIIRETLPGRYTGTLTDALGAFEGRSKGNQLTLSYTMKDGFRVTQVLTLAPDGQSASNELEVTMLGARVAVLAEEIVKAH
ncbi:DUF3833 family protein [Erythrobacter sp. SCSIO 43205]|uniref:DUF3833 family protein n=1 Tax=Erythrobacter sp. SCSIO 43205 TaxID=2779361 RepID=UPI001CA842BA|nr:DUF3833 family protein [Erythrobacter sp. SCSIO 43205]UAB77783.1 DUF3833 family protein [Erythrobacter sp. SCSIO 43205]